MKVPDWTFGLLIVAVLIMAVGFSTNWLGYGTTTPSGSVVAYGACPQNKESTVGIYAIESLFDADGNKVAVEGGGGADQREAFIYINGDSLAFDAISFDNTAYNFSTTNHELSCGPVGQGDTFKVIAGGAGGHGYYWTDTVDGETEWNAVDRQTKLEIVLVPVGGVTLTMSNATQTGITGATGHKQLNLSVSQTSTALDLEIAEDNGSVWRTPTIFFNYNATAFDSIEVAGQDWQKLATIPQLYSNYEEGWYYTKGDIVDFGSVIATLKITSGALPASLESVAAVVADLGSYVSQGEIVEGYEDLDHADLHGTDTEFTFGIGHND